MTDKETQRQKRQREIFLAKETKKERDKDTTRNRQEERERDKKYISFYLSDALYWFWGRWRHFSYRSEIKYNHQVNYLLI